MKYELRNDARYSSDEELLDDLKSVAKRIGKNNVSSEEYNKYGKFCHTTFQKRFGSWNASLRKSGLELTVQQNIPNTELFDNLEVMWRTLGRQPYYNEVRKPFSKYSTRPYDNRFGGWRNACKAFIDYKKGDVEFVKLLNAKPNLKSTRFINEKTRLRVLKRDNYRCVKCGRSPATHRMVLHIDHVKPFSKGGNNNIENLQTLCNKCNLGKGNDETV